MRKVAASMALGLSVVLLTGCGGSDSKSEDTKSSAPKASKKAPQDQGKDSAAKATGTDGTWKPINKSPIATLTITGSKVTTTGKLACPGVLKPGKKKSESVITLNCESKNPDRSRGTLELDEDGSRSYISWDGPAWGGMIDSLRRA